MRWQILRQSIVYVDSTTVHVMPHTYVSRVAVNIHWQVEYCRLADLPDLNQDNQWVRDQLKNWVKNLVQTYNFDGIRIDTVPEVRTKSA